MERTLPDAAPLPGAMPTEEDGAQCPAKQGPLCAPDEQQVALLQKAAAERATSCRICRSWDTPNPFIPVLDSFFPEVPQDIHCYLLIDPLVVEHNAESFLEAIRWQAQEALFCGSLLEWYAPFSPLVVGVKAWQRFVQNWFAQGENSQLGVVVHTPLPLALFAAHMRQFLVARRYDDEAMLLRLYDPLVMQHCKDLLSPAEYAAFMKPLCNVAYMTSCKTKEDVAGGAPWKR